MRELLPDIDRWRNAHGEIALATVVGVHGSTPRPLGSHMVVTAAGEMSGSVSGGCVESDVARQAAAVLDGGPAVVASYTVADLPDLAVGLACGGTIDVLIERLADEPIWAAVRAAVEAERPVAWVVALGPEPPAGARLAVLPETVVGSLDTALDERVADEARAMLREGAGSAVISIPFRTGAARFFIETLAPPARLLIVGATHIAAALTRIARVVGFRVTIVDPRESYARRERFPDADEVLCAWPDEALAALDDDSVAERTCVVTLTHDAKLDMPALVRALRSRAPYVGALGSRRTHERREGELREQGFGDADLARIHAPVGLDLGGRGAEEIALAIVAEIVALRNGRTAVSLVGAQASSSSTGPTLPVESRSRRHA